MLSVDSTLTPNRVYEVLTSTADKVGQYPYDENGWNQYLGYGRINAYRALKALQKPPEVEIEHENNIPGNIVLYQNYPNPFNPSTTIKYSIPVGDNSDLPAPTQSGSIVNNVTLKIFDLLGREVAILVNEKQKPGNYEVEFDGNELSSGIYFYRLQVYPANGWAGDPSAGSGHGFVETKKMIFMK